MDIKTTRKIIVGATNTPTPANTVVKDVPDAEAKALIAVGYAVAINSPDTKALRGAPSNKDNNSEPDALAAILSGTVPEITAALETLTVDDLKALHKRESEGQNRKGVIAAIEEYDLGDDE